MDNFPIKSTKTSLELIERVVSLDGASGTKLAEEFDLPQSTVHDHLKTLQQLGFLVNEDGSYKASTQFLFLGEKIRRNYSIFNIGSQEATKIADNTGEYSVLMIEENGEGVLLFTTKGENADPLPLKTFAGIRMPLYTTAPGKAILAYMEGSEVKEILENSGLKIETDNTITEYDALVEDFEGIRERGFAVSRGERVEGMLGIAAPILGRDGKPLGALSVYGPIGRLESRDLVDEYAQLTIRAANVIEVNLNYA